MFVRITTLLILGLRATLIAQLGPNVSFRGEITHSSPILPLDLTVELYDQGSHMVVERTFAASDGSFTFQHANPAAYEVRLVNGRGDVLQSGYIDLKQTTGDFTIHLPEAPNSKPGGVVALASLSHHLSHKAVKDLETSHREFVRGDLEGAVRAAKKAISAILRTERRTIF